MAQTLENNKLFSYLLGTMPETQKQELEQAFFERDDQFELMLAAEDDLIDAYVRAALSAPDRQAFEQNFLTTPERAQRVQFARTLLGHVEANPPVMVEKASWWKAFLSFSPTSQLAMAAAVLVAAVLISQMMHVQSPAPAPVEQAKQSAPAPVAPAPLPDRPSPSPRTDVLAFALTPGLTRGTDHAKTLQIPAATRTVQLQLNLEATDYSRYSVAVQTPEGEDVWKQAGLRSKGKSVTVDVPASVLTPRDYVVRVSGVGDSGTPEDVAEYSFRTSRK